MSVDAAVDRLPGRRRRSWSRPAVPWASRRAIVRYAVLLLVAVLILVPIVFAVLGGFKSNGQLVGDPTSLCPTRGSCRTTRTCCSGRTPPRFWQELLNSTDHRRRRSGPDGRLRRPRRVRLRPDGLPRPRGHLHPVHARPAVPDRPWRSCPSTSSSASSACRATSSAWPCPRPPSAAADDRHPATVLPEHPDRARGRGHDRRLRLVRVLLADPPAAGPAGPGHGQRPGRSSARGTRSCCPW